MAHADWIIDLAAWQGGQGSGPVGALLVAEGAGQFVTAHLRPAGEVATLRLLVELGAGLRARAS